MYLRGRTFALVAALAALAITSVVVSGCSAESPTRAIASPGMVGGFIASPSLPIVAKHAPATYHIQKGANLTKRIILTYDDCPRSITDFKTAITYASQHDIGLAIFPIGDCVRTYRKRGFDLVAYARMHGIWVGNHSADHRSDFPYLSKSQVIAEIEGTVVANYGRPPYGAYRTNGRGISKAVLSAYASISTHGRNGIRIWNWTFDTNDWKGKSRAAIARLVVGGVRAGDTVLMHMHWHGFNSWTMSHIRDGLAKKGLKLCRVWRGEDHVGPIEPTSAMFPDNIC